MAVKSLKKDPDKDLAQKKRKVYAKLIVLAAIVLLALLVAMVSDDQNGSQSSQPQSFSSSVGGQNNVADGESKDHSVKAILADRVRADGNESENANVGESNSAAESNSVGTGGLRLDSDLANKADEAAGVLGVSTGQVGNILTDTAEKAGKLLNSLQKSSEGYVNQGVHQIEQATHDTIYLTTLKPIVDKIKALPKEQQDRIRKEVCQ